MVESLASKRASGGGVPNVSEAAAGGKGMAALMGGGDATKMSEGYRHFRHWCYVAINAIAQRLAGQPVGMGYVTREAGDANGKNIMLATKDASPETKARLAQNELKRVQWQKGAFPRSTMEKARDPDALEIVTAHPILDLLERPNSVQHKSEFLYCLVANLYITGVAYIMGGIGENGEGELWATPSTMLTPVHDGGLFTSYKFQANPMSQPEPVDASVVGRIYFPDPADLKAVLSPLRTQLTAIRTDEKIQTSQEQMFDRGIYPNLLLHVGKNIDAQGKVQDRRPVLTSAQRRQIDRTVRQVWLQSGGAGMPGIIDGLIENVTKLSSSPAEMDWLNSGQQVKSRIFQAFKVNPISVGEITPANRAQAVEADKNFCTQAVNPPGDAISTCLTEMLGRKKADEQQQPKGGKQLVVWIQPAIPLDEDLRLRKWDVGMRNNAASKNEYRTEILDLPPVEDENADKSPLLSTVGGITGAVAIASAVGIGQIAQESATEMFVQFFGFDEATAKKLAGEPLEQPGAGQGGAAGAIGQDDGGEPPEPPDDEGGADSGKSSGGGTKAAQPAKIPRRMLKAAHVNQRAHLEQEVSRTLASFFAENSGQLLAGFGVSGTIKSPTKQARRLPAPS